MGLFSNRQVPNLPTAPQEYEAEFFNQFANVLRLYFQQLNSVQQLNVAKINIELDTLPTEADVASLRPGDVYRDTTADNALKVKV